MEREQGLFQDRGQPLHRREKNIVVEVKEVDPDRFGSFITVTGPRGQIYVEEHKQNKVTKPVEPASRANVTFVDYDVEPGQHGDVKDFGVEVQDKEGNLLSLNEDDEED